MSTSPLELDPIVIPKIQGQTILDVGSGYGKWGFLIKKYFWATRHGNATTEPYLCALDAYPKHLETVRRHAIYNHLVGAQADALPFKNKTFDTVLGIELIEHLPKEKGYNLLSEFGRVAKKCIIISSPNFEDLRDGHEGIDGYNPFEAHLSFWTPRELKRLGFTCYGLGMKWAPGPLKSSLASLSYRFPFLGQIFLAVKTLS